MGEEIKPSQSLPTSSSKEMFELILTLSIKPERRAHWLNY